MQAVIGALRAVLGLDSVAFEKGADDAKKKLSSLEKSFNQFGSNVSAVSSKLSSALAVLGVGLSAAALVAFRKHIVDIAGGLDETAQQLGLTSTQFQAYRFATEQAGVKTEELQAAFIKLNDTMGQAGGGKKEAVEFFKNLGVNILDAAGKMRPTADVFDEIIKKINGLDSAAEKTSKLREGMGRSAARLLPAMEDLSKGVGRLEEEARKAGNVIERDVIDTLDRSGDKAIQAQRKWEAFSAAIIATGEKRVVDQLTKESDAFFESLKRVQQQVGKDNVSLSDMVRLLQAASVTKAPQWLLDLRGMTAGGAVDNLKKLEEEIANRARAQPVLDEIAQQKTAMEQQRQLDSQRRIADETIKKLEVEIAGWREQADSKDNAVARHRAILAIAALEKQISDIRDKRPSDEPFGPPLPPGFQPPHTSQGFGGTEPPSGAMPITTIGVKNPPIKSTGQSPEERAKQNLDAWKTEMKDFQASLKELEADSAAPLEDVEKRLESQRRLTERIRQGLKGLPEGSPLAQQIKDQAKATEDARFSFEEYLRAAKDADTAEKQFGDGSKVLAQTQRDLAEAYTTGRLTLTAQTAALAEATRTAELQRLKMIGLTNEGWGGFIAGMQTAKLEWDRANNAFAAGQQFFESTMSNMTTALETFVATGKISFRSLANSIIADLIRMQLRAAATGLFGALSSALGSLFGGGFSGAGTLDGYTSTSTLYGGPRAGGGPVLPGMSYLVGEQGPEVMVPSRAGTIIPNDALGGAGGGDVVFNISVTGGDEAGTYRALNRIMPQLKTQLADYILDRRLRGGKFQQGFRG